MEEVVRRRGNTCRTPTYHQHDSPQMEEIIQNDNAVSDMVHKSSHTNSHNVFCSDIGDHSSDKDCSAYELQSSMQNPCGPIPKVVDDQCQGQRSIMYTGAAIERRSSKNSACLTDEDYHFHKDTVTQQDTFITMEQNNDPSMSGLYRKSSSFGSPDSDDSNLSSFDLKSEATYKSIQVSSIPIVNIISKSSQRMLKRDTDHNTEEKHTPDSIMLHTYHSAHTSKRRFYWEQFDQNEVLITSDSKDDFPGIEFWNREKTHIELFGHHRCSFPYPFIPNLEIIKGKPFKTPLHRILHLDNCYLHTGYRIMPTNSYIDCLLSMFSLHNETMNMWTHFVPASIYLLFSLSLIFNRGSLFGYDMFGLYHNERAQGLDVFMFLLYCIGQMICFFGSVSFHMFRCNSIRDYHLFLGVDFCGILSLLCAGNMMVCYFEYYCYPLLAASFILLTLLFWVFQIFITPYLILFRKTDLRTLLFIMFACIGFVAWGSKVWYIEYGIYIEHKYESIRWMAFNLLLIFSALIIRRIKVPERLKSETFDTCCASHQIFHIMTAIASFAVFFSYLHLFNRHQFHYALN